MNKRWIGIAAINMAIAVAFGALGAHALKSALDVPSLESYSTAVRYHLIHSIALLILSTLDDRIKGINKVRIVMFLGMVLFSGSIYLLSTRSLFSFGEGLSFLGPITPIGGLFLIGSWILLAFKSFSDDK